MAAMTAQVPLPLLFEGAIPIGDAAGLVVGEDGGAVFVWGVLWWSWQAGDDAGRRLAAVQLVNSGVATRVDVAAAFGVSTVTVWRWQGDYDEGGVAGLAPVKPGPKRAWKITGEVTERIVELDRQGATQQQVADEVGVSTFSVRRVLREAAEGAGDGGQADADDGPVGVARPTPRDAERQAARYGQIEQADPVFTEGLDLPRVGLLLALPGLEATGLVEVAEEVYGRLNNGFYGLRSVLLTLVFLALAREPRAEGATRVDPADLGRVLGLDRGPEVSTIRRKLGELADRGQAGDLMSSLAARHVAARPDAVGFLYLDGHVRVYHGTRRLPKAHVARMRIAMPATLETWVCDQHGDPVFAVTAAPSASMVAEVRRLLPDIRGLVGDRRATVVFDRGGWSPDLFAEILDADFDLLTYRKGKVAPEPASAFTTHRWVDERGVEHVFQLADRTVRIRLSDKAARARGRTTIRLRQIVRRSPDGHQTHILTSRFDLPAAEIAARMFNRWRQENYFRYGRHHFALDALDTYTVRDDDPGRSVPNPKRAKLNRQLRAARAKLAEAQAAYGSAAHDNPEAKRPTVRGFKIAHAELGRHVKALRAEVEALEQQRSNVPTRVPLAEIADDARLLDDETKLITHACRIAAYNTESSLARELAPHYARACDEARSLLREALNLPGDLHLADRILHVTLNPASAPRRTRALAALCETLNATQTVYPGTDLTIRYAVKPHR